MDSPLSRNEFVQKAMEENRMSKRLWFYSNYHCNLACTYCLTESSPSVPKRVFQADEMISIATEAAELGFESIGITGGEPFLLPNLVDTLHALLDILPVTLLTNGTLFHDKRIEELRSLAGKDLRMQISLDYATPQENDAMRAPGNFEKVIKAIPKLLAIPLHIRVASTIDRHTPQEEAELNQLIETLGIAKEDHIVRKIIHRGRAQSEGLGINASIEELMPELTLTVDGAFWSPFAPTYKDGRLQKDLLISNTISPLHTPVDILLSFIEQIPYQANEHTAGFV